ncbi:MAG: prolyl oligopeptidase family serine peptidase [Microthrixaceae bacterium]
MSDSELSQEAPFGSWASPLSPLAAAAGSSRFGELVILGPEVLWLESRPGYARPCALFVSNPEDALSEEFLPGAQISARSRVNEYGGGSFWVHRDPRSGGQLFFVHAETQRLMIVGADARPQELPGAAEPTVQKGQPARYASGVVTPDGNWVICERESTQLSAADNSPQQPLEVVNEVVAVSTTAALEVVLLSAGHTGSGDFTAGPKLSPDGMCLAWLRWDHPDMPWDAAELWAANLQYGLDGSVELTEHRRVAGGHEGGRNRGLNRAVSVSLPEWSPDGHLWWCDDSSDWWHLYCSEIAGLPDQGAGDVARPLIEGAQEEVGEPRWVAGGSRYGFTDNGLVIFAAISGGFDSLWSFNPLTLERELLPGPRFTSVDVLKVEGSTVAVVAGLPDQPISVWHIDLESGRATDLRSLHESALTPDWIATPQAITFATDSIATDSISTDSIATDSIAIPVATAHGLFYPPKNPSFHGPATELPPLLVRIHGGPTAASRAEYSPSVAFWTTRGFAVMDVNYRGSTGYGRRYRDLLRQQWGVSDVQDCIAAARALADLGLVDPHRCVIRGGSSGGFTALAALCFQKEWGFDQTFRAGCSLYGVTDLAALAADTHKFESRYLDGLVGPLPESAEIYRQRSPLFHAEHLTQPVLLLQGAEDKVVPPAQAEVLVAAMKENNVPHAYVLFEGEGHGFLRKETVIRALETELAFYGQVLGFVPDGNLNPVEGLVGWPPDPSSGRMGA